ncbi:MAG: 30S ribosomal protein S13 [Thermoproteota archaeon]|nr:30S ribosomal protein S13 [Thermoproteota archaeon]
MAKEFQHIVRIADTDVDGTKKVVYALLDIKGVGTHLADVIVKKAGVNPETRIGFLSDVEIKRIGDVIENPLKHGVPSWLLNRRKDLETGKDLHLTGSDLVLKTKADIQRLKELGSWRGYRHAYGLKVRGQRTRTTGRTGRTMGVKRKKLLAKQLKERGR